MKPSNDNPKILIAEDQPVSQKFLSMILDKLGYDSILACDGEDAMEKAQNNEPALVFLDIQMPKMNGYEVARNLRNRGFRMPIIADTAGAFQEEYKNCLEAGMNDVLIKPFKRADIEKMLEKWVKAKGTPGPDARRIFAGDIAVSVEGSEPLTKGGAFDAAEMLNNFMHNREAALPLLSRFIERTRGQLENLPVLEKAADWETARREAHMIKGAAYTMGGSELGRAAALLERAYKDIARDEMKAAYLAVSEAFASFRKEAEKFVQKELI